MTTQRFISNPQSTDVPRTADVVIIGGGPAGTAALWALAKADPSLKLVLIEQSDRLGAGSSLASLENYRTCWPTPCLARMMARSIDIYHHADDTLGEGASQALALKQQGYLFCGFTDSQADSLKADVTHLHAMGMTHVEFLDADAVRKRFSWLGERVIAAKYDPIAGWLDSNALIYKYAQSADNATIVLDVSNVAIRVERGRVCGVTFSGGAIDAPNVIIAAGANARQVAQSAGVDLPIVVIPRQSFTTGGRHPEFPSDAPMIIGAAPYPHVRPEAREGAILGWEYTWSAKYAGEKGDSLSNPVWPVNQFKDARFPSIVLMLLARQFGHAEGEGFASPVYLRGIHHNIGYYTYRSHEAAYIVADDGTHQPYESERAIIDAHPDLPGLFLSVAHVGHGIMSSAAAGEIIAARVLRQELPDPLFADFGYHVHRVEHDANAL